MAALRVLHVVPTFYPATFWGGPIFSLFGLCNALAEDGAVALKVLSTDAAGLRVSDRLKVERFPEHYEAGYEVYFCRRALGHSVAPSLPLRLWRLVRWADIVHLTAVYSWPTLPTLLVCRLLGKPLVWSPRGALQRWEGSSRVRLKDIWERVANALLQRGRAVLHVTSADEGESSHRRLPKASVRVIPNGVEVPEENPAREWLPGGNLRLLYIGRLDPKKGLENLIAAMAVLRKEGVSLTICGAGEPEYEGGLRSLVRESGLDGVVRFAGHVGGELKTRSFRQTDICVVPSFTENFAMVVAEALAHGVPVVASKGTPWAKIVEMGCGFWVGNSPDELVEALRHARGMDLEGMGREGREWMRREFGWGAIAAQMTGLYREIRRAGDQ